MLDQQKGVYASYTLKRFPVDKLKLDRTFITGLPYDKDDVAISHSIIDVAHNLGLTTIAQGVETKASNATLNRSAALRCKATCLPARYRKVESRLYCHWPTSAKKRPDDKPDSALQWCCQACDHYEGYPLLIR